MEFFVIEHHQNNMKRNRMFWYDKRLKSRARELRNNPTAAEAILWKFLRRRKFGVEFHRQVPIDRFIVDFYCHELKLALELDGEVHRTLDAKARDSERDTILTGLGISVIRFENESVFRNLDDVLHDVQMVIRMLTK